MHHGIQSVGFENMGHWTWLSMSFWPLWLILLGNLACPCINFEWIWARITEFAPNIHLEILSAGIDHYCKVTSSPQITGHSTACSTTIKKNPTKAGAVRVRMTGRISLQRPVMRKAFPCHAWRHHLSELVLRQSWTQFPLLPNNTLGPRQDGRHFADDIFKRIFLNENVWISIHISLKFNPGPMEDIPVLVQIMAWCRPGNKPLSEPMMVWFPDAYTRHSASMR